MILEVFIYIFLGQITVGWSKNICNLIITVVFNFSANMTIKYSLNRWDQSITVGSSYDFKYDNFDIFSIYPDMSRYIFDIFTDIFDISPIFYRYFRYISDILSIFPIYLRYFEAKNHPCTRVFHKRNFIEISVRYLYIGEISAKFPIFQRFFPKTNFHDQFHFGCHRYLIFCSKYRKFSSLIDSDKVFTISLTSCYYRYTSIIKKNNNMVLQC